MHTTHKDLPEHTHTHTHTAGRVRTHRAGRADTHTHRAHARMHTQLAGHACQGCYIYPSLQENRVTKPKAGRSPRCIVLAPTRELANQVCVCAVGGGAALHI